MMLSPAQDPDDVGFCPSLVDLYILGITPSHTHSSFQEDQEAVLTFKLVYPPKLTADRTQMQCSPELRYCTSSAAFVQRFRGLSAQLSLTTVCSVTSSQAK